MNGVQGFRDAPRPLKIVLVGATLVAVGLLVAAGVLFLMSNDRVARPLANPVDVGFSQDMSTHHLQGVQMANTAREKSHDLLIRQLAFDIETSQLEQAGRMKGWLSMWNEPEQTPGDHMTWMRREGAHGQHAQSGEGQTAMPGMASPEELDRLRSLNGTEFDTFFLQLMIRHHRGGAPMMDYAAQRAESPQVRNLAKQMATAQSAEIEVMVGMLVQRGARPLPG